MKVVHNKRVLFRRPTGESVQLESIHATTDSDSKDVDTESLGWVKWEGWSGRDEVGGMEWEGWEWEG